MRKRIIPILILVIIVTSTIVLYTRWTARKATGNILMISGNIEAHESLVGFKVQGRLDDLPVQEGQSVREGDLIARLDTKDYEQQVRIDEASVRSQQAELDLALAGTRSQEIKAAEQALFDAKADLELKKVEFQAQSGPLREQRNRLGRGKRHCGNEPQTGPSHLRAAQSDIQGASGRHTEGADSDKPGERRYGPTES